LTEGVKNHTVGYRSVSTVFERGPIQTLQPTVSIVLAGGCFDLGSRGLLRRISKWKNCAAATDVTKTSGLWLPILDTGLSSSVACRGAQDY